MNTKELELLSETNFSEYCNEMHKLHPQPFEEDTRNWKVREQHMKDLFNVHILVEAWIPKRRGGYSWEYDTTCGYIEEVYEGVWGYGGDAIAVKINDEWWPSSNVREKK